MATQQTGSFGLHALIPTLTAELPQMIDEVLDLLGDEWPDYARFVAEHYDTIMVVRDPWLLDHLRAQVLAPLDGLPTQTRRRLEETLSAWLSAMGNQQATARALHVHPQTVRYRLGRLRAIFGPSLDDPLTQRRLMLAVCWGAPPT